MSENIKKPRKKRAKNNYINADDFKNEVVKSQEIGQCTEKLGELLLLLHDHVLTMTRFVNKPKHIKDEIKSYSIYRILKRGILTFDISSTARKCFNYFTTACVTNMTRCLIDMDAYAKRRQKYIDDIYDEWRNRKNYDLYT